MRKRITNEEIETYEEALLGVVNSGSHTINDITSKFGGHFAKNTVAYTRLVSLAEQGKIKREGKRYFKPVIPTNFNKTAPSLSENISRVMQEAEAVMTESVKLVAKAERELAEAKEKLRKFEAIWDACNALQ